MSAEIPILCDHEGCQAPAGGPCALGHTSAADCPDAVATVARLGPSGAVGGEVPPAGEEPEVPPPPDGTELAPGISLTVEEANSLAGRQGARLVIPAGPTDAGKTTFIIELYARFLGGKQQGASFHGSQTLLDFELLSFPARLGDEAQLPTTWRTRVEDASRPLLHLGIRPAGAEPIQLLLGNYSGELFERISDHGGALGEVPLLGDCQRLLFFLDGELLSRPGTRGAALSRTRQLIRVLGEEDVLSSATKVALVVAKLDCLEAAGSVEMEKWTKEEERLRGEIEALDRPTRVFRIAVRPRGGTSAGDESAALFEWLLEPDTEATPTHSPAAPSGRAFERYGEA